MSAIKSIFNFYINSSIHVALAVCSLCAITFLINDLSFDLMFFLLVFLATITGYNFVKYAGVAKLHHISLTPALKTIQVFSLFCFVALMPIVWYLPHELLLSGLILASITVLYALPIFPKHKNLRMLHGWKIFLIAIVWSCVAGLLPFIYFELPIQYDDYLLTIQFGLFVICITLPFDIRDLKYDHVLLGTIPQKLGIKKTKILGLLILGFTILIEFLKDDFKVVHFIALIISCALAAIFLVFSTIKQGKYYSSFWVESMPMVWFAFLVLFIRCF